MNKVVLFDIDYTLFDTQSFKDSNLSSFKNFEEVADVLEELSKIAKIGIFSTGERNFQHDKLLNTKIMSFFKPEDIHVSEDKEQVIEEILQKYSQREIFLVDDKIKILKLAKEIYPSIHTIWVKRGPYVEIMRDVKYEPDTTIENLKNIASVVAKAPSN